MWDLCLRLLYSRRGDDCHLAVVGNTNGRRVIIVLLVYLFLFLWSARYSYIVGIYYTLWEHDDNC